MQEYPVYQVHAEAGAETGVDAEIRISMGAGGGLPGMATATDVVTALCRAMTDAGATVVTATLEEVQSSSVPTS
jgi:hypothetical protein